MSRVADDRIESLLAEARGLLAQGRNRAAEEAFGRVLLHDPAHAAARDGRGRAEAALAEEQRRLDALLHEARDAALRGDEAAARTLAEEVLHGDGDRDAALTLLDRLDAPALPRVVVSARDTGTIPLGIPSPTGSAPTRRWRRTVSAAWVLAFTLLTAAVVTGWESHVARLTAAPLPELVQAPPVSHYPAPTAGERAIGEARGHIQRGQPQRALAALAAVRPEDPAYPLAVQLRAQADRALAAEHGR